MSLFGGKRSILQRALSASWRNDEERKEILDKLKDSGLKGNDAIGLLFHADAGVRQVGVDVFLTRPDEGALRELLDQLPNQQAHVRAFVSRLFPRLPDDLMQKVVDSMLVDRVSSKQRTGWDVALNLGPALRQKYLERAVKEAPPAMRTAALQRLLKDRKPEAMADLLVELARDPEPRLAATALEAAAQTSGPHVIDLMLDRFANGDATSREIANQYLQEAAAKDPDGMRKRMIDLLSQGEDATRRLSVEILLKTGQPDKVILDILTASLELSGWIRDRILDTLRTFGDDVLKPAVALLQHPQEDIRTAALVLVEHFHDPRVVGPVCRLLQDDDWWLRITACDTLGRLKDERSVPYLVKALEDEEARWAAIDALAQVGSVTALKPLAGLLREPRQEVRLEVVQALSKFTDARLLPLLKSVKEKDPSVDVRTRAEEVMRDMAERLHVEVEKSEAAAPGSGKRHKRPVDQLLADIREMGASDVHISVGEPPFVRFSGELRRLEGAETLSEEDTDAWIQSILNDRQKKILAESGEIDFCHAIPEVGRYRANAFRQRKGMCATFRTIPNLPPTFADLRLPGQLTQLLDYHQGIIVVSGPAGSGKSTTLAAIINLINESKSEHILTLEDPIEFVHPVKQSLVNQREVGKHTASFARALRGALREDPDVIMVGEMRDVETIRMSLMAAETGHLVIATLHTTSAIQTVERLIGAFPPEEQAQVRMGLSESLKYVCCQSLVRRKDGKGRVGVFEVLKGTFSVGNLIRDDKTFQIPSMMQIGRNLGMQTVDMALMDLVESDLITPETAWARSESPANFEALCDPNFIQSARSGGAEEPKAEA